jgi:hypothetical protein
VLIDGGSSINLLYRSSMEKLGIPLAQLKPSRLTFHGIMPGHLCTPMGRVQLEVFFWEKGNADVLVDEEDRSFRLVTAR